MALFDVVNCSFTPICLFMYQQRRYMKYTTSAAREPANQKALICDLDSVRYPLRMHPVKMHGTVSALGLLT